MKLDILVTAAHPDDAELFCAGTMAGALALGKKVGVCDFTRGELGTRGTPEIRLAESEAATALMALTARVNLGFRDGFFENDEYHRLQLAAVIRHFQPDILISNALHDRHPDHGRGHELARDAAFLAGLRRIETSYEGQIQAPWRPKHIYAGIQDRYIKPDVVVDITPYWPVKEKAIRAFKSQFYDPNSQEPDSYISSPEFMEFIEARAKEFGHAIGVKYGEGFCAMRTLGVRSLFDLI